MDALAKRKSHRSMGGSIWDFGGTKEKPQMGGCEFKRLMPSSIVGLPGSGKPKTKANG